MTLGAGRKYKSTLGHLKKHDFQPRFLYSMNPLSISVERELLRHSFPPQEVTKVVFHPTKDADKKEKDVRFWK